MFLKKLLASIMVHGKILLAEKHKGVWLRGRAHPSHGWGHKFKSCNAHQKTAGRRHNVSDLFSCAIEYAVKYELMDIWLLIFYCSLAAQDELLMQNGR